ncbi:MAG: hypothetical protein ACLQFF_12525 [Steroidobacteraceae bacterium]|jgi:hypothetical protein
MSPKIGGSMPYRILTHGAPIVTETVGLYEDSAGRLRAAVSWLRGLGVDLAPTRFGHYLDEMESYAAHLKTGAAVEHTPRFYAASADGHVLMQLHSLLSGRYDRYVMDRIERASKGTDSVLDETGDNSDARNFAFELSIASWLVSCGLELNCADPADVAGHIAGRYLIVQCKRVRSAAQVEKRGAHAAKRLRERLDNPNHENMIGAVAFDFTPLANPGLEPVRAATIDAQILWAAGYGSVRPIIQENARHWRAWNHPQIAAVFNRVLVAGASFGPSALLYHFIFQGLHSLASPGTQESAFIDDFNRAAQSGAVLGAGEERKITL